MLSNPLLLGGGADYQIQRSLRLRASASASLNRTPSSNGDSTKGTLSTWVKLTGSGIQGLMGCRVDANNFFMLGVSSGNIGLWMQTGASWRAIVYTNAVFRDPSAWYHVVIHYNTGGTTGAGTYLKVYVNGVLQTLNVATAPNGGVFTGMNSTANQMQIGLSYNAAYFDGYLSDYYWLDGIEKQASDFGQIDPTTGVWTAKRYIGTYGTNGFYMPFTNTTSTTTLCYDSSGNSNHFTPSNISLTAGATYDSMTDVPLAYGTTDRGNYCTLNPLAKLTSQTTIQDGNLDAIGVTGGSNWGTVFSTMAVPLSGKWYVEATARVLTGAGNSNSLGVVDSATFVPSGSAILYTYATGQGFDGVLDNRNADTVTPVSKGVGGTAVTGRTATTEVLMLAIDCATGKIWAGYSGTWLSSGDPAAGTGQISTRTMSATDVIAGHTAWNGTDDSAITFNFGQRPFTHTPPTGFKALHTGNLSAPTITKPNKHFDVALYVGNGATKTVTGLSFQPDFVWVKDRVSGANGHRLNDSVRGVQKGLLSHSTSAEVAETNGLTAFTSDGFTVGSQADYNAAEAFVSWDWKAGGAAVTNNAGSISAQVSANAAAGFSIVTWLFSTANNTVGHGLGVAPKLVIAKDKTSGSANWLVWHTSFSAASGEFVALNLTSAKGTAATAWGATNPTSAVFGQGTSIASSNGNSMVAYCFSEIAGYSKIGSYTGNGSNDGTNVVCGFRPAFVLLKRTDAAGDWNIFNNKTPGYNVNGGALFPNLSAVEDTNALLDFTANGFKLRNGAAAINTNGGTFIFLAIAETPFQFALAR